MQGRDDLLARGRRAADHSPTLLLNSDDSPVHNTVVVIRAALTYSPDARDLVATPPVHPLPSAVHDDGYAAGSPRGAPERSDFVHVDDNARRTRAEAVRSRPGGRQPRAI